MSAFEELGAGLGSLSLGNLHGSAGPHENEDDLMDIDSLESYDMAFSPQIHDTRNDELAGRGVDTEGEILEAEEDSEYVDEDLLILHTLSPTVLGAKYALKPRRLLMPPPPKIEREAPGYQSSAPSGSDGLEYDYEFDTSMLTSVGRIGDASGTRQRHVEGLNGLGHTHPFMRDRESLRCSVLEPPVPALESLTGRSLQYESKLNPIQIHHHHYYPQETDPLDTQNTHNTHNTQQLLLPNAGISSQMLPSPWDPRAVPAERTPYVLSSYLQLLINVVLSGYAVHIVIAIIQAIRQDVAHKINQEANNLLVEMALCERSYHENYCSPDTIVPALEKMCAYWEKCMNQDPFQIGNRSLVSAHTIGMILNSLIEPLSFKFLVVGAVVIMMVFACNFAFGYIRAKTYYGWTSAARRI
ncbi:hypothetical protein METBIDRAFT_86432 [Metschnikowia bicuspidata var. bicuspidata NRRL YB-4993]|uniref:Brl1/Brr6 domain-containing protein n=1 Tax=Metschnikowia bicuspidata var. bicuspidata NRRL YB-4993 TaxID=869754 RepID=A0A1A0HKX4_9ASCO|nr:hypothetical protein METBIDRAFT_86432 [Metschnikowia bicuspidata var. bicuspidata NRRL YB-4993]OBA24458.1 hypothetical protein METBIDRAFT_86432 [Metschnikowia bicuspidata var. bicuspidata NRRL YB-4993]